MADTTTRPPGRPRSVTSEHAILTATLELLAERGFDGTSTDAVARKAGASKATIYRRWPSKNDLVLAAIGTLASDVPDPNTGTLEDDLRALVHGLIAVFSDGLVVRLIPTIVEQMARKPNLAAAMREGFIQPRRAAARNVLMRARQRGEITLADTDVDVALDLLAAPLYYRSLITGEPVDHDLGEHVVSVVLAWVHR